MGVCDCGNPQQDKRLQIIHGWMFSSYEKRFIAFSFNSERAVHIDINNTMAAMLRHHVSTAAQDGFSHDCG